MVYQIKKLKREKKQSTSIYNQKIIILKDKVKLVKSLKLKIKMKNQKTIKTMRKKNNSIQERLEKITSLMEEQHKGKNIINPK